MWIIINNKCAENKRTEKKLSVNTNKDKKQFKCAPMMRPRKKREFILEKVPMLFLCANIYACSLPVRL